MTSSGGLWASECDVIGRTELVSVTSSGGLSAGACDVIRRTVGW